MEESVKEAIIELTAVLESVGEEVFSLAVAELFNTNPTLKSPNPLLQWEILLLWRDYDPDEVLAASYRTAIDGYREYLENMLD
ncbi:MAG: hypothetical protein WBB28_09360 [Crinalium sp.]